MTRTSIIIPTRNRAEMVVQAVRSALELEGPAREIIVVNDGSEDETMSALAAFRNEITVLQGRGQGKSNARNLGLNHAHGEWIAFLDDDDLFLPKGIPELERLLGEVACSSSLAYGNAQYVKSDPSNPLVGELPPGHGRSGWVFQDLLRGSFMITGTMLVRREVALAAGCFDPTLPFVQDYDLWLRVAQRCIFQHVPVDVCRVRLHESNSTRNTEEAGRLTELVKERHLLSRGCLAYAQRLRAEGEAAAAVALSTACVELSLRRWWEGQFSVSRAAFVQALRLSPQTAAPHFTRVWRAWLPLRRPKLFRREAIDCLPKAN